MKVNWEIEDSQVEGVQIAKFKGDRENWYNSSFLHCGWAHPVIFVNRVPYLADKVVTAIFGRGHGYDKVTKDSIKFGPGGRRIYRKVTEGMVEDMLNYQAFRVNKKEEARANEINDFAMNLIDLL